MKTSDNIVNFLFFVALSPYIVAGFTIGLIYEAFRLGFEKGKGAIE
jgi:hypothetical protein